MPYKFNPISGHLDLVNAAVTASNSFATVQPDSGTSPAASSSTDTLILSSSDKTLAITGNSGTKTVDYTSPDPVALAALNIDWKAGNIFTKSISGNSTFTMTNVCSKPIVFDLTTTGAFTAAFTNPSGYTITWPGGAQPVQTANGTDTYTFVRVSSTKIRASVVQGQA